MRAHLKRIVESDTMNFPYCNISSSSSSYSSSDVLIAAAVFEICFLRDRYFTLLLQIIGSLFSSSLDMISVTWLIGGVLRERSSK